jgi:hypothetical protein
LQDEGDADEFTKAMAELAPTREPLSKSDPLRAGAMLDRVAKRGWTSRPGYLQRDSSDALARNV